MKYQAMLPIDTLDSGGQKQKIKQRKWQFLLLPP
jgi:hypothetical protein